MNVAFHVNNLRRLVTHLRGDVPDQIRIRNIDAQEMMERCRSCHRQEFADWQAGPHGVSYERIFLSKEHNSKEPPMDDCLRCHGAHFGGGIRDLVTPISTTGPWRLKNPSLANLPAIPCMACHQMHRQGQPHGAARRAGHGRRTAAGDHPSFDRALRPPADDSLSRTKILPLPEMRDSDRDREDQPDPRQGLCYQCHAAEAACQVGSADDRTPMGVHEGLSCMACHLKHGQKTRASCATCHPRLSNCGLDVETMDTTFKNPKSAHNVHFVKCADCHTKGVPKKKQRAAD